MRIKQKELGEPDYQYSRFVNGKLAVVQVFSKPCYCVNIIAGKSKSCYPLNEDQYKGYCLEAVNWYNPDKEFFLNQGNYYIEFAMKQEDMNMYQFFLNVSLCYYKRAGLNEDNPFNGDPDNRTILKRYWTKYNKYEKPVIVSGYLTEIRNRARALAQEAI